MESRWKILIILLAITLASAVLFVIFIRKPVDQGVGNISETGSLILATGRIESVDKDRLVLMVGDDADFASDPEPAAPIRLDLALAKDSRIIMVTAELKSEDDFMRELAEYRAATSATSVDLFARAPSRNIEKQIAPADLRAGMTGEVAYRGSVSGGVIETLAVSMPPTVAGEPAASLPQRHSIIQGTFKSISDESLVIGRVSLDASGVEQTEDASYALSTSTKVTISTEKTPEVFAAELVKYNNELVEGKMSEGDPDGPASPSRYMVKSATLKDLRPDDRVKLLFAGNGQDVATIEIYRDID